MSNSNQWLSGKNTRVSFNGVPVTFDPNVTYQFVYEHPFHVSKDGRHKVIIDGHDSVSFLDFSTMTAFTNEVIKAGFGPTPVVSRKSAIRRLSVDSVARTLTVKGLNKVYTFGHTIFEAYEAYIGSLVVT